MNHVWDVAVIGGGPAGLAAAALTASSGQSTVLLEQGKSLGGRAVSAYKNGAYLNLGPHAFYRNGAAQRVLERLGITVRGGAPGLNIAWLLSAEEMTTTAGLLFGTKLTWTEKKQVLGAMLHIRKVKPQDGSGRSWEQYLAELGVSGRAADMLKAMSRLGTYAGDAARLDAGTALMQLQKATLYPHGGWQSIVDSLTQRARNNGVRILTESGVSAVQEDGTGWRLQYRAGSLTARKVIVAADPDVLQQLFGSWLSESYAARLSALEPVKAACLDVHLKKLPVAARTFALGVDEPLYMSVHSRWARLTEAAEEAVIHVMRYEGAAGEEPAKTKQTLMSLLDRLQPGWRDQIVTERFMPNLTVTHARPSPELKGTQQRPPVDTGIPGVYAAGDWVGEEGLLLEASMASAEQAAESAVTVSHGLAETQSLR